MDFQHLIVGIAMLGAGAFLTRSAVRTVRGALGDQPTAGSCGSCAMKHVGGTNAPKAKPLVQIGGLSSGQSDHHLGSGGASVDDNK
jgi:hypothetical protein